MKLSTFLALALVCLFSFHIFGLTNFPVFADEAIYLRWSQSAVRDSQYLFLPMLDGKPPLHAWLLAPFMFLPNTLWGGRLLSVLLSGIALIGIGWLLKSLGAKKQSLIAGSLFFIVTPFWFFHAHLALAEMLLCTAWIWMLGSAVRLVQTGRRRFIFFFGACFGAALWTKTTALFFIPAVAALPYVLHRTKQKDAYRKLIIGGLVGLLIFAALRISPLFPSLFSRSEDYTFSVKELLAGEWRHVLFSTIPNAVLWMITYLTPFALIAAFFAAKKSIRWWWIAFLFSTPIVVLGKVLSPRYLLPAAVPLTVLVAFGFESLRSRRQKILTIFLTIGWMLMSFNFDLRVLFSPNTVPFVQVDRHQYLEDWSSGHGLTQVAEYIKNRARQSSAEIIVATEGNFGSLPDGLTTQMFRKPEFSKVRVEGIGVPVREIPAWIEEALNNGSEAYLVVNNVRLQFSDTSRFDIIAKYPRPNNGPELWLLRLKRKA